MTQLRDVADRFRTRAPLRNLNPNGYWVCVVVVELAGTAGVVVVVVLVVLAGVEQPDSDAMTTAAKQAMMSFFISIMFVWFVTLPARNYTIGRS